MALTATGMAAAMETAFVAEWLNVKGDNLAAYGQLERQILFIGIARGILRYLEDNQNSAVVSVRVRQGVGPEQTFTVTALDLNI
jgi:hypothetical protein